MADTLKRLAGPTALTNAAATVYTVPASVTGTVRNIHVANESASTATFTMSVGTDGAGKRFFYQINVPPNNAFDWSGVLVLATGEVLQAYSGTASVLTLIISGVEG